MHLVAAHQWYCRSSGSSCCLVCKALSLQSEDTPSLLQAGGADKHFSPEYCSHCTAEEQKKGSCFCSANTMSKWLYVLQGYVFVLCANSCHCGGSREALHIKSRQQIRSQLWWKSDCSQNIWSLNKLWFRVSSCYNHGAMGVDWKVTTLINIVLDPY